MTGEVKYEFEISQVVRIIRLGGNYSLWTEKFEEFGLKQPKKPRFTRIIDQDKYFVIFNRSPHTESRPQTGNIYAIQCIDEPDVQYVMHESALEAVTLPGAPVNLVETIYLINLELNESLTRK